MQRIIIELKFNTCVTITLFKDKVQQNGHLLTPFFFTPL